MPTLPLPSWSDAPNGVALDAGDLPISSTDDVLGAFSDDIANVPTAPVRDAIVAARLAADLAYQDATAYAAAQSDSLRACGEYLDEIGAYERGVKRGAGEQDPPYRARVNSIPSTVDPDDIIAAANAVLAPYTPISCRYAERLDGVFPGSPVATEVWRGTGAGRTTAPSVYSAHAFADARTPTLFTAADGGAGATPNYPDRQYAACPNRRPAGTAPFGAGDGPATWPRLMGFAPGVALDGTATLMIGTGFVSIYLVGIGTNWGTSVYPWATSAHARGDSPYVQLTVGDASLVCLVTEVFTLSGSGNDNVAIAIRVPSSSPLGNPQWLGEAPPIEGIALRLMNVLPYAQDDVYGRTFVLRVPDISAIDSSINAVYQLGNLGGQGLDPGGGPPENTVGNVGSFVGGGAQVGTFAYNITDSSTGIYQAVVDAVEALRGHGVRWTMISDPILTQ